MIRPNASVEDTDDDVLGVIGDWPEAKGVSEAHEVGGAGSLKLADAVWDDR